MNSLKILGAIYGKADVTEQVKALQSEDQVQGIANNRTFGDSWRGTRKTLVIVYKYNTGTITTRQPQVLIVEENQEFRITPDSVGEEVLPSPDWGIKVLGAAYGKRDITSSLQDRVVGDSLNVVASNTEWGDSWRGVRKSMVMVYQYGTVEVPFIQIVEENENINIQPQLLTGRFTANTESGVDSVLDLVDMGNGELYGNLDHFAPNIGGLEAEACPLNGIYSPRDSTSDGRLTSDGLIGSPFSHRLINIFGTGVFGDSSSIDRFLVSINAYVDIITGEPVNQIHSVLAITKRTATLQKITEVRPASPNIGHNIVWTRS